MEGIFLDAPDIEAVPPGVDAVFLTGGPMGDAIVLAAGLAGRWRDRTVGPFVGVRTSLGPEDRHPTILARDMTTLDHVTGGRTVLAFTGPFNEAYSAAVSEAVTLCRAMWTDGVGVSEGPRYPVVGAINRPLPKRPGGPLIALDLTKGTAPLPDAALLRRCDLVLMRAGARAAAAATRPGTLPPGVEVCWIREE
jgi:hypothetical protein